MSAIAAALQRLVRITSHATANGHVEEPEQEPGEENHGDEGNDSPEGKNRDEDDEPPAVAKWLGEDGKLFQEFKSFHGLYVSECRSQIFLRIKFEEFDAAFFNQVTFTGSEGSLPDMVDVTPEAAGYHFSWSPSGKEVHLCRLQQKLSQSDLASSLYSSRTGGPLPGFLEIFHPVAVDKMTIASSPDAANETHDVGAGSADCTSEGVIDSRSFGNNEDKKKTKMPERLRKEKCDTKSCNKKTAKNKMLKTKSAVDSENNEDKKIEDGETGEQNKDVPPLVPPSERSVIIDATHWFQSFALRHASEANGRRSTGVGDFDSTLLDAQCFPSNFFFRFAVKSSGESSPDEKRPLTSYYSVSFSMLPKTLMAPRAKDRRVGYFETPIAVGGRLRVNVPANVINRWNLDRQGGQLRYYVDPEVPDLFHNTIRNGVESWNAAFRAAGCGDHVVRCILPSDKEFPQDFTRGDARYNAIYMTDSSLPVLGFGPSLTDFRTGEILVAHVLLGFSEFVKAASKDSVEVFTPDRLQQSSGCRAPLLDADHADVQAELRFTVMHEVGHTLGLRHNFIAQEDGSSSVMCYPDSLDTLSDPENPTFCAHALQEPGRYDVYAIKYGYTPLLNERAFERHPSLDLLANGQEATDTILSDQSRNPLFATDEDCDLDDPRVNVWNNYSLSRGYDKMEFALHRRRRLLGLLREGRIYPETFTKHFDSAAHAVHKHVSDALRFIGGSFLNAARTKFTNICRSSALDSIGAVVDFCVGPLWRLTEEESCFMLAKFPDEGYRIKRKYFSQQHADMCSELLEDLLCSHLLSKLEEIRACCCQSGTMPLGTFDVLIALAFRPGKFADGLMHPFKLPVWCPEYSRTADTDTPPNALDLTEAAQDGLRAECVLRLARLAHRIANDQRALAAVQVGARAFIHEAAELIRSVERSAAKNLNPVAKAHWALVLEELTKPPDKCSEGGNQVIPFFMFGKSRARRNKNAGTSGCFRCAHGSLRIRKSEDEHGSLRIRKSEDERFPSLGLVQQTASRL